MLEDVMDVRPILDHLLVRPSPADESIGGILLPESSQRRPAKGKVLAAGPGRRTDRGIIIPMATRVGDLVYYNAFTGVEVTVAEETLLMMRDDDILAVEQDVIPW